MEEASEALNRGAEALALSHFLKAAQGPLGGVGISAALAAADLLEQQERNAEVVLLYEHLLKEAEPLPEIYFTAGRFFVGLGQEERGETLLERALKLDPDLLATYPLLAALKAAHGDQESAAVQLLEYEQRLNRVLMRFSAKQTSLEERLKILDLLATLEDERITQTLIQALKAPEGDLRIAVAAVLMDDRAPAALKALAEAVMAERDPLIKQILLQALKRGRDRMLAE